MIAQQLFNIHAELNRNESKTKENNYKLFQLQFSFHFALGPKRMSSRCFWRWKWQRKQKQKQKENQFHAWHWWKQLKRQTNTNRATLSSSECLLINHSFSQSVSQRKTEMKTKAKRENFRKSRNCKLRKRKDKQTAGNVWLENTL